MLTDKGSIKTASVAVAPALDLYRKKLKIISIVMLIVGTAGLVAYVALGTVFELKWLDVMLIFAVPFTLGLIGTLTVTRLSAREKKEGRISSCEFFADCFIYNTDSETNFQPRSKTDKIAYSDAVLKRENEKYGYIFVFSFCALLEFCKDNLTDAELNAIRKNFRKAVPDGEDIAKLENYKNETEESPRGL